MEKIEKNIKYPYLRIGFFVCIIKIKRKYMRTGQAWLNCLNPTLKEKVLNYKKFDKNSLKEKHESFSQFLLESIAGWPGETYDVFIGWPKWVNSIYEEAVKIETQKK